VANTAVLNPRRQRLLRNRVSRGENVAVVALALVLALVVIWVLSTANDYDPAARDIAPELLGKSVDEQVLYPPPLKLLTDPNAPSASGSPVAALLPFPTSIVSDGWSLASRVRRFEADTLFEKINGEAPKFLKQGFQSLHYVVLASGSGEEIGIELFDQGDRGGSLGLFGDHRSGNVEVESIDGVDFFRTAVGAIGRRGQFFFRILGDADTESVQLKAVQIATALSTLAEDDEVESPAMAILTEQLGFDDSNVTFQKANVFKFDFASDFWFVKTSEDADTRLFIHESDSEDAARDLLTELHDELTFDFELIDDDLGRTLYRHNFLKNYFALAVSDKWVHGVENAESEDAARTALDQFEQAFSGE